MEQVNTSICCGMGSTGKKRRKLYMEGSKARGYKSFSAYLRDIMDRELNVDLPTTDRGRPAMASNP